MKRIKVITSYAGHSRINAECADAFRWMARKHCPVRTPFSSGPSVAILNWNGKSIWIAETSHKRYEVWEIPSEFIRATEAEANEEQFK